MGKIHLGEDFLKSHQNRDDIDVGIIFQDF